MHPLAAERALALVRRHAAPRDPITVPPGEALGLTLASPIKLGKNGTVTTIPPGRPLTSRIIGLLVWSGVKEVSVIAPPCVAVITVGDDRCSEALAAMLAAQLREAGAADAQQFLADETLEDLAFVLDHVAKADVVVITGGAGTVAHQALAHHGTEILFHQVAQSPGEEMLLAVWPPQLVLCLPAEPAAARICCQRYVGAAIRSMTGLELPSTSFRARLRWSTTGDLARTCFTLVRCEHQGGELTVTSLGKGMTPALQANGYVAIPPGSSPLREGDEVDGEWIEPLAATVNRIRWHG
jgi:molybdopterin biosynthesis enzyme